LVDPRVPSFRQVIDLYCEGFLFSENHVNSKHQKANFKQIPMTQILKSKQMIRIMLYSMASSQADLGLQNDAIQLRGMFWTLKIEI